jgi:hypothetical protein
MTGQIDLPASIVMGDAQSLAEAICTRAVACVGAMTVYTRWTEVAIRRSPGGLDMWIAPSAACDAAPV